MKLKRMVVLLAGLALLASCNKKPQEEATPAPDPTPQPTVVEVVKEKIVYKIDSIGLSAGAKQLIQGVVETIEPYKADDGTVLMVNASGKGFFEEDGNGEYSLQYPMIKGYEDMSPSALFSWHYEIYKGTPQSANDRPIEQGQYYYLESEEQRALVLKAIKGVREALEVRGNVSKNDNALIYRKLLDVYPALLVEDWNLDKVPNYGGLFGGIKTRILLMYLGQESHEEDPKTGNQYSYKLYNDDDPTDATNALKELSKIEAMMQCLPIGVMMINDETMRDGNGNKTTRSYNNTNSGYMMEDGSANISGGRVIRHRLGIP